MAGDALIPYPRPRSAIRSAVPLRAPGRAAARSGSGLVLLALLALLPVLMQVFQYLLDVRPLWALAKASPILLLPLALYGLLVRPPHVPLYLLVLFYVLLVAPVLSMLQLENNLVEALGTTLKVWSFTFYFVAVGALVLLRPDEAVLNRAFLTLAALNFAILWFLWIVMPATSYVTDSQLTSLFLWDYERGPRIMLPLAFGVLGLFWLARHFSARPGIWQPALVLLALVLMLTIYKQRTAIAAVVVMVLWGATGRLRQRYPLLFWSLALGGASLLALLLPIVLGIRESPVQAGLGGSLEVRQHSAALLTRYLGESPWRWIFGIGSATDYSDVNMKEIFRSSFFFMSDLGWLGVLGEYGVLGSLPILAIYLVGLRETARAAGASPTPLRLALQDFVGYLLLVTLIYSVVYTPGQIATVTGIAVYLLRRDAEAARTRLRGA